MNITLPLATKPFLEDWRGVFSNGGQKHNLFELTDWGTFSGICPSWKKNALNFCPRN